MSCRLLLMRLFLNASELRFFSFSHIPRVSTLFFPGCQKPLFVCVFEKKTDRFAFFFEIGNAQSIFIVLSFFYSLFMSMADEKKMGWSGKVLLCPSVFTGWPEGRVQRDLTITINVDGNHLMLRMNKVVCNELKSHCLAMESQSKCFAAVVLPKIRGVDVGVITFVDEAEVDDYNEEVDVSEIPGGLWNCVVDSKDPTILEVCEILDATDPIHPGGVMTVDGTGMSDFTYSVGNRAYTNVNCFSTNRETKMISAIRISVPNKDRETFKTQTLSMCDRKSQLCIHNKGDGQWVVWFRSDKCINATTESSLVCFRDYVWYGHKHDRKILLNEHPPRMALLWVFVIAIILWLCIVLGISRLVQQIRG